MGAEFTGGGFEEFEREAKRAAALAARGRQATEQYIAQVDQDKTEQQRLAQRARQSASRNIAAAETVVARAQATSPVAAAAQPRVIAEETRAMDRLALSSQRALEPITQMRQWGPYAFSRSAQSLQALERSWERIQRIGALSQTGIPAGAGARVPPGGPIGGGGGPPGWRPPGVSLIPGGSERELRQYTAGLTRASTAHAVLNAQMQRHGALSTEFLAQLARGNVGLRELSQNLIYSAGKFGGWLLAGSGIFAVLGAIGQIGGGAISAANGVQQLRRVVQDVDPNVAQAGFRDLATQFNLPTDQVTDAVYQMGKVFHDTNKALEASKAVLYAVKVGELDVATAARYLTSIQQGFNLEAQQQTEVFDQVNQAQNRYGVSISNLLSGTAKSAGAFRAAGGDVTHLIALITTLSKATGSTGDVVGTAIQRSPHFIAMDEHQETLKRFGVDPTQSIQDIYDQSIKVAQKLAPDKQRELAEALFGSQYGSRIGIALLNQGPLLKQVLADVAPAAAKDSAKNELEQTLKEPTERIKALGVQLANLGSNLAQSGFLNILLLAVGAIDKMLGLVNTLLDLFNGLPDPLKNMLATALQVYGVFRLLRALNVGRTLGSGPVARALTQPDFERRAQRETAIVNRDAIQNEVVGASQATTRAELDRAFAEEQYREAARRTASASQESATLARQGAVSAEDTASLKDKAIEADRRVAEARARESFIARQFAGAQTAEDDLRRAPRGFTPLTGQTGSPREVLRYIDDFNEQQAGVVRRYSQQFSQHLSEGAGVTGSALRTGASAVRSAATRAQSALSADGFRAMATRARQFGAGLNEAGEKVSSSIGPLDVMAVAGALLVTAMVQAQQKAKQLADVSDQIREASSGDEFTAARDSLRQITDQGTTFYEHFFTNTEKDQEAALELEQQKRAALDKIDQSLYLGRSLTSDERTQTSEDTLSQYATILKNQFAKGAITRKELNERIQNLIHEARNNPNVQDAEAFAQQIRTIGTAQQASISADAVKSAAAIRQANAPLYDPVGDAERALTTARRVREVLKKQAGDRDAQRQADVDVAEADRALREARHDQAVSVAEAANTLALSQIRPDNAVARARQALSAARAKVALFRQQDRSKEDIEGAVAAVNDAEFAVQTAVRERLLSVLDITTRIRDARAPLYAPLQAETSAVNAARARLGILRRTDAGNQAIREGIAVVGEAERALSLAQNERAVNLLQTAGQMALTTIDPENSVGLARQAVANAQQVLSLYRSQGRDAPEIQQALLTVRQAEVALNQAIEQRADAIASAQFDLQAARAEAQGNDVRSAAIAARQALYNLQHADTREERIGAQAALRRARAGQRDAVFQTELEDIQFGADIGRLTVQEQIRQYQNLLHTLQLNKDMRRQLRSQIASLRQQSDADSTFELSVGDIRLPTYYEIKRAIGGGVNSSTSVVVNNENNVNVNGAGDPEAVGNKIVEKLGGHTKAGMRSAGLR